jgi:hypothetical protein
MNDKSQALQDDLAFMRDMAQAGASTPLVSGTILIIIGALFGVVSIVHWVWFELADPSAWMVIALWLGAAAICWVACFTWAFRRMNKKPGVSSPANVAVSYTWNATGWTVNVLLLCTLLLSWKLDSSQPFTVFPSIIAAVYGGAWFVSQKVSSQAWMRWPMFGAFGFALLLSYMIDTPYLWLAFSAAFFLIVMVPGIIMVRREPSTIV